MPTVCPSSSVPTSLSYTNSVRQLALSQVPCIEKVNICNHLLSSHYHPDPSAAVINFLCSLIAKEAPSVDECYTIRDEVQIPEHAEQCWNLLRHALLRYTQSFGEHSNRREAPLIPKAVLVQGGLHLLQGSFALRKIVAGALHLIIKCAQYSQDLEMHTWLLCAVARAEGLLSALAPLRTAILPQYSSLIFHEQDKDLVAAAAAAIASQAVPSSLACEIEGITVQSLRASPQTFHDRFAAWVLKSEASLPQVVQFLLRAYLKHPLKTSKGRSSGKRVMWEPAQRDALEFFVAISDHILQAIKSDGDQKLWSEGAFQSRMKTVQTLYLIGAENTQYFPLHDILQHEGNKRKKNGSIANKQCLIATGLHGVLHELLGIVRSLHLEAEVRNERVRLTFQAIGAIAKFSLEAIDEHLPGILTACFMSNGPPKNSSSSVSNKSELFCTLLLSYEQSRELNKFLGHMMNSGSLHALIAILRQRRVQDVLGAAFSHLREAEARACIQSLVMNPSPPATDISALTLLYSLLLETIAPPFIQLTAVTIANQIINLFAESRLNPEIRQCRFHLLSSFLIAKAANTLLCAEEEVRVAIFRLAYVNRAGNVSNSRECVPLELELLEVLSSGQESMGVAESCSNIRCLTALVHYSLQYCEICDAREFITRALHITFRRFGFLHNLLEKLNASEKGNSIPNTLYGSNGYRLVLDWLGSLGNLLTKLSCIETNQKDIILFLSEALRFLPATHPLWNELSEQPEWGSAVAKAACLAMDKRFQSFRCSGEFCVCPASRVLEGIFILPSCFFVVPECGKLLHMVLDHIAFPCCSESRLNALKACMNLNKSSDFGKLLLTFCYQGVHTNVKEADCHLRTSSVQRKSISRYDRIIATMCVVASQTPDEQVSCLSPDLVALLKRMILELKTACQRDMRLLISSPGIWYEVLGTLLDLRTSLASSRDISNISSGISIVAEAAAEFIKAALPICVKSLDKESSENGPHSEAAEHMLSAMLKGTSPIYRQIFSKEECDTLHDFLTHAYLRHLLHPQNEKRDLVIRLFVELPVFEGRTRQNISEVLLSLLGRVLRKVRGCLPSVLRSDENRSTEAINKLVLMATSLTISLARLCALTIRQCPEKPHKSVLLPHSCMPTAWVYSASTSILSGLEEFTKIWSCAVQELSARRKRKLQTSSLLFNSESLICFSLKAGLEIFAASRSWSRPDVERILLLTKQAVERICSCENFLNNEGEIIVIALRICRTAARRHSGLIPSVSQVVGILLRRGIHTENIVILAAVREAVEEVCTISKTWEVLSALLADCSTALNETIGADVRREAEKSASALFKAVGQRKAQQVLGYLEDSGKESLIRVWELFSDKLHYSGE